MSDAGTYTLRGENRNGSDKVDLDLVVLDTAPDCECEMLKNMNLDCHCSQSFRYYYMIYHYLLFHQLFQIYIFQNIGAQPATADRCRFF